MNCALAHSTIHGYFDGELDAVRSAEFELHLENCAECQAELGRMEELRSQIKKHNLYERASPELRDRVRNQLALEAGASRAGRFGTGRFFLFPALGAVVAAAAVMVIGFFLLQSRSESARITAELIDAHVRSLQPGHLADVESTDQHTVKPWFDGKLDFVPPVTDFSQQGFPLVGGRLDVIDNHNVAALVYSRRKHLINLFAWPYREKESSVAHSGSRQGYNWVTWQTGDMRFCLVSDVSTGDLLELKRLISPQS